MVNILNKYLIKSLSTAYSFNATKYKTFKINHMIRFVSTYKGAILKNFGETLQLEDVNRKKLKKKQVRVAVHCCGVNASDLLMIENKYDQSIEVPFVPGFEISGEVLEIGEEVTTLSAGLRVVGLNKITLGGFAEECVLNENDVWPIDMSVSFEKGASLTENYATALIGLNRRAEIDSNSTVMITAAAGGLGLAAVDLAANVYKSKVIGVCGTDDKADLVREKGAWAALKYNKKHMQKKVRDVTDGKGVDVIFDAVGGDVFDNALPCIGTEGRVMVAGFASRVIPHIETSQLLPKALSLIGISLTSYMVNNNKVYRQAVQDVIDMHEANLISPHVSATFPLEQYGDAFEYIRQRKSTGKVVLEIR